MLLALLAIGQQTAQAQQPQPASPTTQRLEKPDTAQLLFTFSLAPEVAQPYGDTLPDTNFRMYDPARRPIIDWGTTGNLGGAARPLLFETRPQLGFDVGIHAFDLYQVRPEQLRFFRSVRSYSEVLFSQGRNQNENLATALLSRTFDGGLTFALDYRTLRNEGQYRYQRTRHNALSLGAWLPVGKRYDGFLIFTTNTHEQQENGGIVTDTVFGDDQFSGPIAAEVRLPDQRALTRHFDWTLQLTQHLKFSGAIPGKRVFRATHSVGWQKQTFKFADTGLANDAFYFANFGFLTDLRGLRNSLAVNRLDNSFLLTTFKQKAEGRTSDAFSIGLTHALIDLKEEPGDSTFSNLFLIGNVTVAPSKGFNLSGRGALGMLNNFGEYQVGGDLVIGLGRAGQLRASILSQRRPPSQLAYHLLISQREVWRTDLAKPVENTLSVTYALPLVGFAATARQHVVSNYIFYDQLARPDQISGALQVTQLLLTENLRLGHFHIDNTVAFQKNNRADVLRLPEWFSKNSFYYSGKMFKKRLLLDAGVDFRINAEFHPDGYQPLTWQFYLQDSLTQKPYPWLDAFVAFKIQTFRAFVRYENMATLWDKTTVFYQTAHYPQPFGAIRFGIAWRFRDAARQDAAATTGPQTGPPTIPPVEPRNRQ